MPEEMKTTPIKEAKFYIKELGARKTERSPLEVFWRKAYEMTFPVRGQKFGTEGLDAASIRAASVSQDNEIYDSTAKIAIKLLVSSIMSGMFPAHVRWLGLELRNNDDKDVTESLEDIAETTWRNVHASNFDVTAFESMVDMVISGMFAMFITEGSEESGQPYNFQQWPLHSIYVSDSTGDGVIDTVYRVFELTAEQAVAEYGEDGLHKSITDAAINKPSKRFDFLHVITPRVNHTKLELPIASIHIDLKGKSILKSDKGFHEMPVIVPRWFVIPDSTYATGPIDDALPDIKTLNELIKLTLGSMDLSISGMWGAVDDGTLNPKSITVGPRKVIVVGDKNSFFPLNSGVDFNAGELQIQNLQRSIRAILLSDQLQPQDGPAMTATEVHVRTQLIRQLLGPLYGRLQVEMAQPLATRCVGIGLRAQAYGEIPEALKDQVANIKAISPLAKAAKLETVGAIERFEAGLYAQAGAGTPEALDIWDRDEANREKAEMLGVPEKLLRDEEDVKALREQRNQQQQDALAAQREAELANKTAPAAIKAAQ